MDNARSSTASAVQNVKTLSRMKRVKISVAFTLLLIMYVSLFSTQARDTVFLAIGGCLGLFSTSLVLVDGFIQSQKYGSNLAMLSWRSLCDLGLAARFVLTPAFNYYVCNEITCNRAANQDMCGLPGALVQFFLVASELWFLCNGIDLFYSITNPFSSLKTRIKYYHAVIWSMATIVTLTPFTLGNQHRVYGFWYVNYHITDSNICWLKTGENKLGFSVWGLFLVPLAVIYIICLLSLFIAYVRLRKGLTRTFLSKMKLLVNNTINVLVLTLYWGIFLFLYALTFLTRNNTPRNDNLNSLLYFTLASKGFSSFFVWIFVNDYNLLTLTAEQDETVDANIALREEVLTFATAGIRSSARGGASCTPEKIEIVRRPEHGRLGDSNSMIGMYFYLKFLLGSSKEIKTVESRIVKKRGSAANMLPVSDNEVRLSQRPTVHTADASKNENRNTETGGEASVVDMIEVMSFSVRSLNQLKTHTAADIPQLSETESSKASTLVRADSSSVGVKDKSFAAYINNSSKMLKNMVTGETWDTVEFTEFHPFQFRRIRLSVGVTDELFASAFSTTLKERLTEGGASGAFFFFSKGENFIAKSCTEEEVSVLRNNAEAYATYLTTNPSSYISKVLGLYQLKIYGNKLNFIVMNNLFYNDLGLSMNEKYDIKGSWVARNAKPPVEGKSFTCSYCEQKFLYMKNRKLNRILVRSKSTNAAGSRSTKSAFELNNSLKDPGDTFSPMAEGNLEDGSHGAMEQVGSFCPYTVSGMHEPNIILKDNDLKFKIRLPLNTALDVLKQLRKDAEFLSSLGIMDYSLLLGVHNTEYEVQSISSSVTSRMTEMSTKPSFSKMQRSSAVTFTDMASEDEKSAEISASIADSQVDDQASRPGGKISLHRSKSLLKVSAPSLNRKTIDSDISEVDRAPINGLGLTRMLEVSKVVGPDVYFMGIIDFQQRWNWNKQLERFFKTRFQGADAQGLSAIEPDQYRERFLRKLEDIIDVDGIDRATVLK